MGFPYSASFTNRRDLSVRALHTLSFIHFLLFKKIYNEKCRLGRGCRRRPCVGERRGQTFSLVHCAGRCFFEGLFSPSQIFLEFHEWESWDWKMLILFNTSALLRHFYSVWIPYFEPSGCATGAEECLGGRTARREGKSGDSGWPAARSPPR